MCSPRPQFWPFDKEEIPCFSMCRQSLVSRSNKIVHRFDFASLAVGPTTLVITMSCRMFIRIALQGHKEIYRDTAIRGLVRCEDDALMVQANRSAEENCVHMLLSQPLWTCVCQDWTHCVRAHYQLCALAAAPLRCSQRCWCFDVDWKLSAGTFNEKSRWIHRLHQCW